MTSLQNRRTIMTEKKVIAFGELMLRLAPEGYQRFVQAEHFGAVYGGGEVLFIPSF